MCRKLLKNCMHAWPHGEYIHCNSNFIEISLTEKDAYLEPTPPPQTQETQQKESINLDDLLYEGLPPVHIPSESDQSESDVSCMKKVCAIKVYNISACRLCYILFTCLSVGDGRFARSNQTEDIMPLFKSETI